MSPVDVPHDDQDSVLAALAHRLAAVPELLLPLDVPGCDGTDCSTPAFHDRSTNTWRHLRDLTRCNHPSRPTASTPASQLGQFRRACATRPP